MTNQKPRLTQIFKNFTALSIAMVVSRTLALIATIYLTRVLNADGFGVIVFATSVLAYGSFFIEFGFSHGTGVIEVSRGKISLDAVVKEIVGLRLILMVIAFVLFIGFILLAPVSTTAKLVTILYGLSLLADALDLGWVFLGKEMMYLTSIADVLGQILLVAGIFVGVHNPENIILMPFIFLISRMGSSLYLISGYIKRFGWFRPQFKFPLLKGLIKDTLPFTGTKLFGLLLHNLDIVLIGLWLGLEQSGIYGVAYRVVWVPILLAGAYFTSLWPSFARAHSDGLSSISNLLNRSMRIATAVAIGIFVGGFILAEPIIKLLFGEGYSAAQQPLQILLAATALLLVNRHYRVLLSTFNQQHIMFKIFAIAAGINITLNIILIPLYGLAGAAFATLISELSISFLGYFYTHKHIGHVPLGRYLLKPTLCGLILGVVLIVTQPYHLIIRFALGSIIYLISLLIANVIQVNEIKLLFNLIKQPSDKNSKMSQS